MHTTRKLHPGQTMAPLQLKDLDGQIHRFGEPGHWQALFVFRGQHCPICKSYLAEIEQRRADFAKLGVGITAVSADSEAQTRVTAEAVKPGYPLLYGMDETTMRGLGLYVSAPRSAQETDHCFPEPALLVVNPQGVLHLVDITNAPFLRPNLDLLLRGMGFVIERNYPIRGTVA